MGNALYVAAGGGGDVIGAAIVHAALGSRDEPHIASFSWDRLLVDPVPGPRDPSSFDGLLSVGRWNHQFMPVTCARPPAGSTLPRLSGELPAALYLLDPRAGAAGLAQQLVELADLLAARTVNLVDIGGDILARGQEPGLRTPLADSLALAALAKHPVPVRVIVAGAGLDGELSADYVRERCSDLGAQQLGVVGPNAVMPIARVFEWHLSEATGLLAAAAMGARGRAQMQAGSSIVDLTPAATRLHDVALTKLFEEAPFAHALWKTASFDEAQQQLVYLGANSEIDYERKKAQHSPHSRLSQEGKSQLPQVDALSATAAVQGIDLLTLRRLAETLSLSGSAFADLRPELRATRPSHYAPPLWVVRPEAWPLDLRPRSMKAHATVP